jgi:ribose transport system permease protein
MLDKTPTGRYIRGIGGNREAIRLSGVNIKYIEILAYVVAGFLSAIGGIIMASRLTLGSNSVGDGWELTAIAAVMIGGASPTGGIGKVGGVIVGTLVMGLMVNIMNLVGISIYWQQIIKGVIIIVAVFTNSMRDIKEKG